MSDKVSGAVVDVDVDAVEVMDACGVFFSSASVEPIRSNLSPYAIGVTITQSKIRYFEYCRLNFRINLV